jgi:hypothetical protein
MSKKRSRDQAGSDFQVSDPTDADEPELPKEFTDKLDEAGDPLDPFFTPPTRTTTTTTTTTFPNFHRPEHSAEFASARMIQDESRETHRLLKAMQSSMSRTETSSQKTSLLFLSTRNSQVTETYDALYSVYLPRLNILKGYYMALQNIEFPNTVYPINSKNNVLLWDDYDDSLAATVSNLQITVPENNYTGPQLATKLQELMRAVSTIDYIVSYDDQAKKMVFQGDVNDTLLWVSVSNSMYEELGFSETGASFSTAQDITPGADLTAANNFSSDHPINISGTAYVDVVTNLSTLNHSLGTTANVLVRVPMNVAFGNVVFYEPATDDALFIPAQRLDEFFVQLRDDKGNSWELPPLSHVSMTMKITPI